MGGRAAPFPAVFCPFSPPPLSRPCLAAPSAPHAMPGNERKRRVRQNLGLRGGLGGGYLKTPGPVASADLRLLIQSPVPVLQGIYLTCVGLAIVFKFMSHKYVPYDEFRYLPQLRKGR